MTVSEHKLKEYMEDQFDILRQQQSSHHSDNLAQLKGMRVEIEEMKTEVSDLKQTINTWKSSGRLAFWIFVSLGGIITWSLNVLGIHIGFRP